MSHFIVRSVSIVGVAVAIVLLAISTFQYSGNVDWTRVTVSLLCASELPNGDPNLGRTLPIAALLLLCVSMSVVFELVSRVADTRFHRKTLQIAGIGSMVYALLTATPMHNLMVNIALAFYLVALFAVVSMLFRKRNFALATVGIACIVLKFGSVSLYYSNTYTEIWGVLQKLSFMLTTTWLIAVLLMAKPTTNYDTTGKCTELADVSENEATITPVAR